MEGLVFLVLMMVVFYFMLIRPQKRRADQHRDLVGSLGVGDEIVTIGGMFGTVSSMDDEALLLEVAPGTTLRVLKTAVARRIIEEDETLEDEPLEEEPVAEEPVREEETP